MPPHLITNPTNGFAHKAGIHLDAIIRFGPQKYELLSPAVVGNRRNLIIGTVLSGKTDRTGRPEVRAALRLGGRMILVKAGGGEAVNWAGLAADIAEVRATEPVIVVHGAHALRDALAARLGVPVRKVVSPSGVTSVYTDEEALEVFLMAYAGVANKRIVAQLLRRGVNAVGLSGVDGRLWQATAKKDLLVRENGKTKLLRNNLTGRVDKVNAGLLRLLLESGYVPVISAPAISEEGEIVNTDNDTAAAVLAEQMGIERLVFLFEAPGLLERPEPARDARPPHTPGLARRVHGVRRGPDEKEAPGREARLRGRR